MLFGQALLIKELTHCNSSVKKIAGGFKLIQMGDLLSSKFYLRHKMILLQFKKLKDKVNHGLLQVLTIQKYNQLVFQH
jgi:hypothetical protein